MSESKTSVAGSSITNATVLLSSYLPPEAVAKGAARTPNLRPCLPPEVVAEGAARSPNLTRFIIAKQSRIEIFHRFQWWRIEGRSNYIRR